MTDEAVSWTAHGPARFPQPLLSARTAPCPIRLIGRLAPQMTKGKDAGPGTTAGSSRSPDAPSSHHPNSHPHPISSSAAPCHHLASCRPHALPHRKHEERHAPRRRRPAWLCPGRRPQDEAQEGASGRAAGTSSISNPISTRLGSSSELTTCRSTPTSATT